MAILAAYREGKTKRATIKIGTPLIHVVIALDWPCATLGCLIKTVPLINGLPFCPTGVTIGKLSGLVGGLHSFVLWIVTCK